MNLPSFRKKINDNEYVVYRLGVWKWRELLAICERLFGPGALAAAAAVPSFRTLLDRDFRDVAEGMLGVLQRFVGDDGAQLMRRLGEHSRVVVDGRERVLTAEYQDQWWAEHPGELLPWLAWGLEIQFKDFFLTPGSKILKKLKDIGEVSPSQPI